MGAAGGGSDVFRPLEGSSFMAGNDAAERKLVFKRVKGLAGLDAELRVAAAEASP